MVFLFLALPQKPTGTPKALCTVVAPFFNWNDAQPVGAARRHGRPLLLAPNLPTTLLKERALTMALMVRDFPVPAVPVMINLSGEGASSAAAFTMSCANRCQSSRSSPVSISSGPVPSKSSAQKTSSLHQASQRPCNFRACARATKFWRSQSCPCGLTMPERALTGTCCGSGAFAASVSPGPAALSRSSAEACPQSFPPAVASGASSPRVGNASCTNTLLALASSCSASSASRSSPELTASLPELALVSPTPSSVLPFSFPASTVCCSFFIRVYTS